MPEEIPQILKRCGLSPRQLLDQHFMTDSSLIKRMVSLAKISKNETVLEIGAGLGTLTREIAQKAGKVIAVELDPRFREILKSCPGNVRVVIGNALKLLRKLKFDKMVSNTPYAICEPLLRQLAFVDFKLVVLSLPKGFVQGLDGDSSLSLFTRAFFSWEAGMEIPRKAFYPVPRTETVVILLRHRTMAEYRRHPGQYLMKKLFMQETKKLKNALREAVIDLHKDILGKAMTKRQAQEILRPFKIPGMDKPVKDLTPEELRKTAKAYTLAANEFLKN